MTLKRNPLSFPKQPKTQFPLPLTINISWSEAGMKVDISRPCASVELASIALGICGSQLQLIAQSQAEFAQRAAPRDRSLQHTYEINLNSQPSQEGKACGLCGKDGFDPVHIREANGVEVDKVNQEGTGDGTA